MPLLKLSLGASVCFSVTAFWSLLAVGTIISSQESSYIQLFTLPLFTLIASFCLSLMAFSRHREALASPTSAEIELGELPPAGSVVSEEPSTVQDFMKLYSEVDSIVRRMEVVKERVEIREKELRVLQREKVERTSRWIGNRVSRWFVEDEEA
ncbi:hypothetical protein K440DRAFT_636747 [Wilcoxina mikolae CBS 423.85]|nr:hypothetical protein K440DRAFT_636747 [Wilcoxina mikolae CBS 423.85]